MTKGHRCVANGLEHHVLEWAEESTPISTVFLLHGYMDAAGTWDRVAPALAAAGLRVLAPDVRGFGDSDRAPRGSYYHFVDYIADLAGIIEHFADSPVELVGHSMGGTMATLYAGAFPERVSRLALLEGVGPPDNSFSAGPGRMRSWIDEVRAIREPKAMTWNEARRRLLLNHPNVPPDVLETRLPHLVRGENDAFVWKFDPLHRTRSPNMFLAKLFVEYAKAVRGPTLFVSGGPEGYHPPDEGERLEAFASLERETIEGAGHMMHWTKPDELAALLLRHRK